MRWTLKQVPGATVPGAPGARYRVRAQRIMVHMGQSKKPRPKKAASGFRPLKWIVVAAVVGAVGYGVSQMSNIAYGDTEIKVVDFSGLDAGQKRRALEAANAARCNCGCGMTLAQCVATDSTCPIRESNVEKIKGMVSAAARTKS